MLPYDAIVPIHGIHDDGSEGVDRLARAVSRLTDIPVREPSLPRRWAIGCYFESKNKADALEVNKHLDGRTVLITHSRGGLVADRVMKMRKHPTELVSKCFMFSPALPADILPGNGNFNHLWVVHNQHDKALLSSRLLPWHPYTGGRWFAVMRKSLGRVGYIGEDAPNITNMDGSTDDSLLDHSNYWLGPTRTEFWAEWIVDQLYRDI